MHVSGAGKGRGGIYARENAKSALSSRLSRTVFSSLSNTCLILGFLADHQCSCVLFYCRYSVENAYLEEKEDTCNALGEVAENSG